MDERLRQQCAELRGLGSTAAADWLLANLPAGSPQSGDAITLIPHLSWTRSDQDRLARHYLDRIPFAHDRPYKAFLAVMSTHRFLRALEHAGRLSSDRRALLAYHLEPLLRGAVRSDRDRLAVERFRALLGAV